MPSCSTYRSICGTTQIQDRGFLDEYVNEFYCSAVSSIIDERNLMQRSKEVGDGVSW